MSAGIAALQSKGSETRNTVKLHRCNVDFNLKNETEVVRSSIHGSRPAISTRSASICDGQNALNLPRDEITYVAFAGWDAVGAVWFGYRTFWLNRLRAVEEHLNASISRLGRGSKIW